MGISQLIVDIILIGSRLSLGASFSILDAIAHGQRICFLDLQDVALLDRQSLLVSKSKDKDGTRSDLQWSFLTIFTPHFRWVNQIIRKHWQVLRYDKVLGPNLPDQPKVLYRRNQNLKDLVAPSVVDPPPRIQLFGNLKAFFPCKRCKVCASSRTLKTSIFFTYHLKNILHTWFHYMWYHRGDLLVSLSLWLPTCGRTTHALKIREGEHLSNIHRGFADHSVSQHFRQYHNRDPSLGGYWYREIYPSLEMEWFCTPNITYGNEMDIWFTVF